MGNLEQRKARRFEVALSAEVNTSEAVLPVRTRNLSSSGVCLDLSEALKEGAAVGVSLFLTEDGIENPDVAPLDLSAAVIWCSSREDSGFSAGCRFEALDGGQADRIARFLAEIGEEK